jgi:hypothetical protein
MTNSAGSSPDNAILALVANIYVKHFENAPSPALIVWLHAVAVLCFLIFAMAAVVWIYCEHASPKGTQKIRDPPHSKTPMGLGSVYTDYKDNQGGGGTSKKRKWSPSVGYGSAIALISFICIKAAREKFASNTTVIDVDPKACKAIFSENGGYLPFSPWVVDAPGRVIAQVYAIPGCPRGLLSMNHSGFALPDMIKRCEDVFGAQECDDPTLIDSARQSWPVSGGQFHEKCRPILIAHRPQSTYRGLIFLQFTIFMALQNRT